MLNILIADDNDINREFLVGVLNTTEHVISEAANGLQAVELAGRTAFDVILMDIRMPELDGIEATQAIRAGGASSDARIYALTADVHLHQREALTEKGFDAFLSKPIARDDLLAAVKRLPEGSGTRRHNPATSPVNREAALAACGGSDDLLDKLSHMLMNELDRFEPLLDDAIRSGDLEAVREMAHKLRASAGYCGAHVLESKAAALELVAMQGDTEAAAQAKEMVHEAAVQLKKYMAERQ